jgi:hypothetical protein
MRKEAVVDFSILVVPPIAAVVTVIWISISVLMVPRSEDRSIVPAFCAALVVNLLLDQPWYYITPKAFIVGVTNQLAATAFGFLFGAFVTLLSIKTIRAARDYFSARG